LCSINVEGRTVCVCGLMFCYGITWLDMCAVVHHVDAGQCHASVHALHEDAATAAPVPANEQLFQQLSFISVLTDGRISMTVPLQFFCMLSVSSISQLFAELVRDEDTVITV